MKKIIQFLNNILTENRKYQLSPHVLAALDSLQEATDKKAQKMLDNIQQIAANESDRNFIRGSYVFKGSIKSLLLKVFHDQSWIIFDNTDLQNETIVFSKGFKQLISGTLHNPKLYSLKHTMDLGQGRFATLRIFTSGVDEGYGAYYYRTMKKNDTEIVALIEKVTQKIEAL
jgi:hypothetical protein